MRSDAALSKLTEDQQADLFDWLSIDTYDVVLKRISQPPPKGFGIRTHINSLFRFYEQRQAQIRACDFAALAPQDFRPTGEPSSSDGPTPKPDSAVSDGRPDGRRWERNGEELRQSFFSSAQAAFAHSTYILANSPPTPATYRTLSHTLHQHEEIAIKREYLDVARQQISLGRERLQLERTQFEYNAARAALALLPELIAIDQMADIDDEAKIWRVRDRLFGTPGNAPVSGALVGVSPNSSIQSAQSASSADKRI